MRDLRSALWRRLHAETSFSEFDDIRERGCFEL